MDTASQVLCFKKQTTVPKYLFQGPLFPVSSKRKKNCETLIKTYSNNEILVMQEGFTQFDLAVSLAYKKIINQHSSFEDIKFSIADFSKALNRHEGGKTRTLILEALKRSNKFHLCFDFGKGNSFDGYRLKEFEESRQGYFKVAFNTEYLSMAYCEDDIFDINIDIFLSLQLGLQSWLYGFICTIPDKKEICLDILHDYSGSNYKNQSDFKKAVKNAMTVLHKKGIIGWRHGITRNNEVFWEYKNPFNL